jgi:hypothetical protein
MNDPSIALADASGSALPILKTKKWSGARARPNCMHEVLKASAGQG